MDKLNLQFQKMQKKNLIQYNNLVDNMKIKFIMKSKINNNKIFNNKFHNKFNKYHNNINNHNQYNIKCNNLQCIHIIIQLINIYYKQFKIYTWNYN